MLNDRVEILILKNLLFNEDYTRKVIPFLRAEYFADEVEKVLFLKIASFIQTYSNIPTKESLAIDCNNDQKLKSETFTGIIQLLGDIGPDQTKPEEKWLLSQTEKFCQDRALYNAVVTSVDILHDTTGKKPRGGIPKMLQDALSVSFDPNIGHNYTEDSDKRYDFYHRTEEKLAFDLKLMNKITGGGVPRKSLNIILAGTAVGKSLAMCHMAGASLMMGKNVLYITLEMAEERIAQRIDANLLNMTLDDLQVVSKGIYDRKIEDVKKKTVGRLIIREYPPVTANANHFRALIQELYLKKGFVPDIIYLDYLNIAASSRISLTGHGSANTYVYVKSIAEEIRGLAVEYNVPIWSATQTTRSGFVSSDIGLEDTSESFGLPATADFMIALTTTEELQNLNQIMVKQLKNRYNDVNNYKRFLLGIDRSKMRLYDIDEVGQQGITDAGKKDPEDDDDGGSMFDKTKFGQRMIAEQPVKPTYEDWKF